ncbi:MAG: aldehyde dehydrogenase family protein [Alphaproteobacteria bacterium 64-11]|nr:aldehyde dehydrogenase family protein [Alphaproteobacteria bacterium]OJU09341.1 MAG: aldehyde dehydrogenase family protein [Alphaproteobacteria bacterium 64-11]
MTETLTHFIGGKQVNAGGPLESLNPSNTNEIIAKFPDGSAEDVNKAVEAARAAFPGWAGQTPEVRADLLDKVGTMIIDRKEALGRLLAREEGKTLPEAIGETVRAGRIFKYFAGEALRRHGQNLDSVRPGVEIQTYREAVGVYGVIAPWNFPIAIPAWKSAPALAFGNTVVLKPANPTPATAHALASIIHEAGAPAGVFNLVLGRGGVGDAITKHPDVNAISFTGSQGVGAKVAMNAVARQARVQLEMGGKNPLVILDDADFDRAVQIALDGGYFATGQRCTASSRVFVQEGIYDRFVKALAERAAALKVGDACDPSTQMGPVVTESQLKGDLDYVDIAVKEGGRLLTGGARLNTENPGFFMSPALIVDTKPGDRINNEEVFGPVVSVVKIKNYDEGLELSNSINFGLSAGIVTSSLKHARHYQRNVKAGMVMINLPTAGVDYHVPFGGSRGSSYGPREQGFAAVEFYTQTKTAYSWS